MDGGYEGNRLLRLTAFAARGGTASATLTLDWERRQRSRLRAPLDEGGEAAVMLPRGSRLRDGDLLLSDAGTLVQVCAAPEAVSVVVATDAQLLLRACYHLANRHVPVQLSVSRLCYRHDAVLDDMLCRLGLAVHREIAPFEAEAGAYAAGDGHHHAHDEAEHDREEGEGVRDDGAATGSLLALLQLASSSLPVGAFAYSQGLEQAVEQGWIRDEAGALDWLLGLLQQTQAAQDVPLFARLYRAWERGDADAVAHWNAWVIAARDSAEARAEERDTGAALARLLAALEPECRAALSPRSGDPEYGYLALYALAAVHWRIPLEQAACGWLWSWCQQQVAAAVKLVPLGQTAAQRMLRHTLSEIPAAVAHALALADEDIGRTPPGLGMAAALHENQYTRLFLS